eukprot:2718317-Alexandrium_andersonii.AAC.1
MPLGGASDTGLWRAMHLTKTPPAPLKDSNFPTKFSGILTYPLSAAVRPCSWISCQDGSAST